MASSDSSWILQSRSRAGEQLQHAALRDALVHEKLRVLHNNKRIALSLTGLSSSSLVFSVDLSSNPALIGALSPGSADVSVQSVANPFLADPTPSHLQSVLHSALEAVRLHASHACESKHNSVSAAFILPDSIAPSDCLPGSSDTVKSTLKDLLEAQLADSGLSVGLTRVLTRAQALHEQYEQETLAKWDAAYRKHCAESEVPVTRACLLVASLSAPSEGIAAPSDFLVLSIAVSIDGSVGTVLYPRFFSQWPSVASATFIRSNPASSADQPVTLFLFEGEQLHAQSPGNRIQWQARVTPSSSASAITITASLGPNGELKVKADQTVGSAEASLVDWTDVGGRLSKEEIDQMLSAAHQLPGGAEFNPKLGADDVEELRRKLSEL